ncbi:DinB family protein [Lutibacter sp. Hel_I_33_5]|uniref:DinB family protein n=1 Tax=Lutibacter sp. Hel_I_33_5 TaxID=1566289 RepID=UPI0011A3134D|nr:DinB family protein [Lutibacter sp. Hel_I_33_5]TVZ55143.1 DinB family protein [Lutibacter sp. Hel_I_33_5]
MNKNEIVDALEEKHQKLFNWLENQPEENWIAGPDGRWTTGQHVLHLVDSLKKLNKAMGFPKFLLKYKFGVSNRDLRSYNEVAKRYQEKLDANKERARVFNKELGKPTLEEKKQLITSLQIQNKKLQHKTNKWKDKNLDNLIIPHPLMGKMPVREIVMWTAHHTEHHLETLTKDY